MKRKRKNLGSFETHRGDHKEHVEYANMHVSHARKELTAGNCRGAVREMTAAFEQYGGAAAAQAAGGGGGGGSTSALRKKAEKLRSDVIRRCRIK